MKNACIERFLSYASLSVVLKKKIKNERSNFKTEICFEMQCTVIELDYLFFGMKRTLRQENIARTKQIYSYQGRHRGLPALGIFEENVSKNISCFIILAIFDLSL